MNTKFSKLIPGIVAACSIMMIGPVTTEAATSYFEANQNNVPVYDNRSGALELNLAISVVILLNVKQTP